MEKIGPKEAALRKLRSRPKAKKKNGSADAPEVAKALRFYRQRLKTSRDYQRSYYQRNREKILAQRKARAEKTE